MNYRSCVVGRALSETRIKVTMGILKCCNKVEHVDYIIKKISALTDMT